MRWKAQPLTTGLTRPLTLPDTSPLVGRRRNVRFVLDGLSVTSAAAYSLRRLRSSYAGAAIRVRRSSDNAEQDIGLTETGDLNTDDLLVFCGAPRRPLDSMTGAAAYSLRKLRTAYTGPAIRVRRSSNNDERDIGFTAEGDLNTVALLAFTGAGSGFITVWYDQSGSGRHATQTTAANQPRIVNAGVIHTLNGRPTVDQVTINGRLNIPAFSGMTSTIVSAVYAQATTNNAFSPWQLAGSSPVDHLPFNDGNAYIGAFSTARPVFGGWSAAANELIVASAVQAGTVLAVYRNGTQRGTNQAATFALPTLRTIFGGLLGTGFVSELIVMSAWDGGPVNRQILERSQAAYFGVTHADPISGFVSAWYDQSGNGQNAVQATAASQPRIVNAGVVETMGERPTIRFRGADALTNGSTLLSGNSSYTFTVIYSSPQSATVVPFFTGVTASGSGSGVGYNRTSNRYNAFVWAGGESNNIPLAANTPIIQTARREAGVSIVNFVNGVSGTVGAASAANFASGFSIGAANGQWSLTGPISEVTAFTTALSTTDRQTLDRNQGAYFGITVA